MYNEVLNVAKTDDDDDDAGLLKGLNSGEEKHPKSEIKYLKIIT